MSKARGCFVRCGTGLEEQMRGRVMSFYTWEIGLALSVIPTFSTYPCHLAAACSKLGSP